MPASASTGVEVRNLTPADGAVAASTWTAVKKREISTSAAAAFLGSHGLIALGAFASDELIGYAIGYSLPRLTGDRMVVLYDIEVIEAHRQQGVGRRLVQGALAASEGAGAGHAWLTTGRSNGAARALYQSARAEEIDDVLVQWRLPT